MEYRLASKKDLQDILELYKQLNPDENVISLKFAEEIWDKIDQNNLIKYFVAVDNNKIISSCNIAIIMNLTRNGRPYAVIENVITDIAYRKQGIGKRIMQNAIEYAKNNNCYKVVLLSSMKRFEAHKFYESIGFKGDTKKGFEIRFD